MGPWARKITKGSQKDAEEVPCRMVEWYHVSPKITGGWLQDAQQLLTIWIYLACLKMGQFQIYWYIHHISHENCNILQHVGVPHVRHTLIF